MATKLELAWSAGIIDGEGCIAIIRHAAHQFKRTVSTRFHLILKVSMCCKKTIDRLFEIFKTGSRSSRLPKHNERVSASYTWICNVRQAEVVLKKLRPYLFTKSDEADVALEFLALPNAPRGGVKGGRPIPSELQAARTSCFERIRALKSRSKFQATS